MRTFLAAFALVLFSTTTVSADNHHKEWMKYLSGSWEWVGEDDEGGKLQWKVAARGNALIGTSKNKNGEESAWIHGWDGTDETLIVSWFGEAGVHGQVAYKIVDATMLSGPASLHDDRGTTKAIVTIKKSSDDRFTVRWSEVTVNGEEAEDLNLVVERN